MPSLSSRWLHDAEGSMTVIFALSQAMWRRISGRVPLPIEPKPIMTMGPLQLADFIGLDVCLSILRVFQDGFGNPKYAPCPLLVNMVAAGKLGTKSGEGFYTYTAGSKDLVLSERFK